MEGNNPADFREVPRKLCCGLAVLMASCAVASFVQAQDPSPAPARASQESGVKIQAVVFQPWEDLAKISYFNKGESMTIELPSNRLSEPFHYSGENPLRFYEPMAPAPPTNSGELPPPRLVAEAQLPQSRSVILIFLRNKDEKNHGYRVIALDSSRKMLPPGVNLFINVSSAVVAGKIDSRSFQVAPNATYQLPMIGDKMVDVPAKFFYKTDSEWRPLSSTIWAFDPKWRFLMFIYDHPTLKRPAMRGVTEFVAN